MTTSLDVNRRGFLGLLFGAAVAAVAAPVVEKVVGSRWGDVLRRLRGLRSKNPVTNVVGHLDAGSLADAFAQVERWDLRVTQVWMHPDDYAWVRAHGGDIFDERGAEPSLWAAEVHVTDEVRRHEAFVANSLDDPHGVAEIKVLS